MDYKQLEGHTPAFIENAHTGFWQREILRMVGKFTDGDFDVTELLNDIDKTCAFHKQLFTVRKFDDSELEYLKLELQKQKELNTELKKGIHYLKGFLDYDKRYYAESLIKKSNEIC